MIRTLEIASGLLANLGMALVVCSLILVPANFARAEEYFSCELTCNVNCNGTGECYQTYDCNSADKCKCNANQDRLRSSQVWLRHRSNFFAAMLLSRKWSGTVRPESPRFFLKGSVGLCLFLLGLVDVLPAARAADDDQRLYERFLQEAPCAGRNIQPAQIASGKLPLATRGHGTQPEEHCSYPP